MRLTYAIIGAVSMTLGVVWLLVAGAFASISHLDPRLKVRFEGMPTVVSDATFACSIGLVLIVAGLGLATSRPAAKPRDPEL